MNKKFDRKLVLSTAKPIVSFLYRVSGWWLGAGLVTLCVSVATGSDITKKIDYLIPAAMCVPLYYLNKYLQKQ